MKFDYGRPAGLRDIHVWKCEHTYGHTDPGSSPILEAHQKPSAQGAKKGARVVTTLFIDFSEAEVQLTPKSVMKSCQIFKFFWAVIIVLVACNNEEVPSKMKALEWSKHFFHYKSKGIVPDIWGQLIPQCWSDLAKFQTHPRFYGCPRYLWI